MSELISAFGEIDPTKSQRSALPWAMSAVTRGLSQAAGLREFKAGGGKIGNELWAEVYQISFQVAGWREEVRSVPLHWTIPEHMFTPSKEIVDWSSRYVFKAEVEYFNLDTNRWERKWIQSGFDELPSHAEWRADALRRMEEEEQSPRFRNKEEIRWITEEAWKRRY